MARPNAEQLKEMTDGIIDAITSEEFLKRMSSIRSLPLEERVAKAQEILSVDGLRSAGVDLPDGMRVSSRYFEEEIGVLEFGNVNEFSSASTSESAVEFPQFASLVADFPGIQCASAGPVLMGTCGGAGAGTVCACGGSC